MRGWGKCLKVTLQCGGKFLLMSIGGRVEGLARADPGARTPIGMRGICFHSKSSRLRLPVFAATFCLIMECLVQCQGNEMGNYILL
jgi:hypothetical protein